MNHLTGAAVCAVVAIALTGCAEKTSARVRTKTPVNPLEITPGEELRNLIKVGEPQMKAVGGTLRVAGRVEADATRMARVSAPVTGRLTEMNVIEGEHVEKGQVLATIYSTELSSAQSSFLKAHSERQVAERAVSRAKLLLDAGVIGSAELQRREADLQQASADVAAAREQLRVLGLSESEIEKLRTTRALHSVSHILATIDGIVLERNATVGQIVEAVEPVFTIANLSNVWLVADVPEESAGKIERGKAVEAEIPALPDHTVRGTLNFVSATVNPDTRTVRVRMNLPNPKRIYKPAMLTTMTLFDSTEQKLVVPTAAVVREGNDDFVFVRKGESTFQLTPVQLGDEVREWRVVLGGVTREQQIVTEAAFHMNNERKRKALEGEEE